MTIAGKKSGVSGAHVFSTCVLAAVIPFAVNLISYAVLLWLITGVVLMITQKKSVSPFRFNTGLTATIVLYILFAAGTLYSANIKVAAFDLQVKLSLLLLPPVMYLLRDFYKKYLKHIFTVFVLANIVAGIICLIVATVHSLHIADGSFTFSTVIPGIYPDANTQPPSYFTYTNLSLFKHPAYFSMYLLLCIFMVLWMIFNHITILKKPRANKWLFAAAIIFMTGMIYLLESKAAYLSLILLMLCFGTGYIYVKRKWLLGIVLFAGLAIITITGVSRNSRFYYIKTALTNNSGFTDAIKKKDFKVLIDTYGLDRIPIWMISGEIIREHLFTGVGTGDVKDALMQKYKKYELTSLEQNRYNTHNQYLETFIALGLSGIVVLLVMVFLPLFRKKNYTKERFIVLAFTGIIASNYLFETVLNTIGGVIFVAFFYGLLLVVPGHSSGRDHSGNKEVNATQSIQ